MMLLQHAQGGLLDPSSMKLVERSMLWYRGLPDWECVSDER